MAYLNQDFSRLRLRYGTCYRLKAQPVCKLHHFHLWHCSRSCPEACGKFERVLRSLTSSLLRNGMGISRSAFVALSAACPCWAASLRCGSQRTRSLLADKNISTSATACWFWSREKPPWPPPGIVISFSATPAFRSASCKRTDCE